MEEEFWIVQTAVSYTIGKPIYRVLTEEPSELEKRIAANYFKVKISTPQDEAREKAVQGLVEALKVIGTDIPNYPGQSEIQKECAQRALAAWEQFK